MTPQMPGSPATYAGKGNCLYLDILGPFADSQVAPFVGQQVVHETVLGRLLVFAQAHYGYLGVWS